MSLFSIKEAFTYGWNALKSNFWFLVEVFATVIVTSAIFSGITQYADDNKLWLLSVVVQVVSAIIQVLFGIGAVRITLALYAGEQISFKNLFLPAGKFWSYVWGSILYMLVMIAGFILLVVPGVVWALKYQFFPWLIVDKNMKGREALIASGKITKGQKGKLFVFWLAEMGAAIVGVICLGVGIIPAAAIIYMASVFVYKKLVVRLTPETQS